METKLSDAQSLPDSGWPSLGLAQPTANESIKISTNTSAVWKDALTLPVYLQESEFLSTVPLAADGGLTTWILVDKSLPPDQREIYCSCESYCKRSRARDAEDNVEDVMIHGVVSVFGPTEYRGRGYAARHMKELAQVLRTWQSERGRVVGSALYSDIGKTYYSKLGWLPNRKNWEIRFPPVKTGWPRTVRQIKGAELRELRAKDKVVARAALGKPQSESKMRVTA
jgi:hypothetical protein